MYWYGCGASSTVILPGPGTNSKYCSAYLVTKISIALPDNWVSLNIKGPNMYPGNIYSYVISF